MNAFIGAEATFACIGVHAMHQSLNVSIMCVFSIFLALNYRVHAFTRMNITLTFFLLCSQNYNNNNKYETQRPSHEIACKMTMHWTLKAHHSLRQPWYDHFFHWIPVPNQDVQFIFTLQSANDKHFPFKCQPFSKTRDD